ncbi:MAG: hypothetical protein KKB50_07700 [Planctomycetes bacterium]|nr:hypothetical protein [Planctomycetota bacterium]
MPIRHNVQRVGFHGVLAVKPAAGVTAPLRSRLGIGFSGVLAIMLAAGLATARAQYPVSQDGRLFDANPQVGGQAYNYARPFSPMAGGNAIASGNVRRGLSIRSFSPIGSPDAFRASLGSTWLSDFRRDSVSVADSGLPYGGLMAQPYYDLSRTAPTARLLSGQFQRQGSIFGPFSQQALTNRGAFGGYGTDEPMDHRLDPGAALRGDIDALAGRRIGEMSSGIFGPTPTLWPQRSELMPDQRMPIPRLPGVLDEQNALLNESPELPRSLDEQAESALTPLGRLLRGAEAGQLLDAEEVGVFPDQMPVEQPGAEGGWPGWHDPAAATNVPRGQRDSLPPLRDPSVLPGYDVFNDMQMALTLARDPQADWFAEMQTTIRAEPERYPELQESAAMASEEFLAQVMEAPIQTFVGRGASALNDQMLRAEALLDTGHYSDAARRYAVAQLLDPMNPLPAIGLGHARLAAGDYLSAAVHLVRGLERFPELARFRVDLAALMGGGEIVDIRRAGIMAALKRVEDPRLRFLLGYLELHSGMRESGLKHVDQAAEEAEPGSFIARYPALMRGEGAPPVPKLPTPDDKPLEPALKDEATVVPEISGRKGP